MFLDAACYRDMPFHSPNGSRNSSIRCYATSFSAVKCELKYDVNFVKSE